MTGHIWRRHDVSRFSTAVIGIEKDASGPTKHKNSADFAYLIIQFKDVNILKLSYSTGVPERLNLNYPALNG